MPQDTDTSLPVQIDIVSDVMCPWCIVGFRQLEQALNATATPALIRWHPFELNRDMPPQGQNLREHITEKYGASAEQSAQNRAHLQAVGRDLGINFRLDDTSRIVNTFAAHQLLDWAQDKGLQHPLKLALFEAHFTQGRDVSQQGVLVDVAQSVGLDRDEAADLLQGGLHAVQTRAAQNIWTERGITGVPAMVFDGKYLLTGAQGPQVYAEVLQKIRAEYAETVAP
jgi:predicted DsbA family dithiol-disulfide isomerase